MIQKDHPNTPDPGHLALDASSGSVYGSVYGPYNPLAGETPPVCLIDAASGAQLNEALKKAMLEQGTKEVTRTLSPHSDSRSVYGTVYGSVYGTLTGSGRRWPPLSSVRLRERRSGISDSGLGSRRRL